MANFWDYNVWGSVNVVAVLLLGLLMGHALKRSVKWLQASLIPTSVLLLYQKKQNISWRLRFQPDFTFESVGSLG